MQPLSTSSSLVHSTPTGRVREVVTTASAGKITVTVRTIPWFVWVGGAGICAVFALLSSSCRYKVPYLPKAAALNKQVLQCKCSCTSDICCHGGWPLPCLTPKAVSMCACRCCPVGSQLLLAHRLALISRSPHGCCWQLSRALGWVCCCDSWLGTDCTALVVFTTMCKLGDASVKHSHVCRTSPF